MNLYFRPDGTGQCLYGEKIALDAIGTLDIKRASHVEPDPEKPGYWYVDLSPVGGPMIVGFKTRAEALQTEEEWLNKKMRTEHVQAQS